MARVPVFANSLDPAYNPHPIAAPLQAGRFRTGRLHRIVSWSRSKNRTVRVIDITLGARHTVGHSSERDVGTPHQPRGIKLDARFDQHWSPDRSQGLQRNDVLVVKVTGRVLYWHSHSDTDVSFLGPEGVALDSFREISARDAALACPARNLYLIVPKGVEAIVRLG